MLDSIRHNPQTGFQIHHNHRFTYLLPARFHCRIALFVYIPSCRALLNLLQKTSHQKKTKSTKTRQPLTHNLKWLTAYTPPAAEELETLARTTTPCTQMAVSFARESLASPASQNTRAVGAEPATLSTAQESSLNPPRTTSPSLPCATQPAPATRTSTPAEVERETSTRKSTEATALLRRTSSTTRRVWGTRSSTSSASTRRRSRNVWGRGEEGHARDTRICSRRLSEATGRMEVV